MNPERSPIHPTYYCPLSHQIFCDPVIAEDGENYEREVILARIKAGEASPKTGRPLGTTLKTNKQLKSTIEDFLRLQPKYKEQVYLPRSQTEGLLAAVKKQNAESLKKLLMTDKRFYLAQLEKNRNFFHMLCETGTSQLVDEFIQFLKQQKMIAEMSKAAVPADWQPKVLKEKLFAAVKANDQPKLSDLLALGASLNTKTNTGKSLLHVAVENGHLDLAQYLIELGIDYDPNEANLPQPLLHIAAENGNIASLELALSKGALLNTKNLNGQMALHKAVLANKVENISYLLFKGADPNAQDAGGNTPLHLAVENNAEEFILTTLLDHGASYKQKNTKEKTPGQLSNKEKEVFLERYHRTLKKKQWEVLETKVSQLETRLKELEATGSELNLQRRK